MTDGPGWHPIAFAIYEGLTLGRHSWRRKAYATFERLRELGEGGGDVPGAVRAEAGMRMSASLASGGTSPSEGLMLPLKAIWYGLALARGDWSAVPPHERDEVVRSLHRGNVEVPLPPETDPVSDSMPDDGPVTVTFAHAWRRRGEPVPFRAEARVTLDVLRTQDVPVAVRLRTPEGEIAVRRHGDLWIRPVLAPGSWTPATVEAFSRAAASGVPWADTPFLAETRPDALVMPLDLYAAPEAAVTRTDAAAIAKARAACLDLAGSLYVVDGVVHRTTPEPFVEICRMVSADRYGPPTMGGDWRVAWRCGALDSLRTMRTDEFAPDRADFEGWGDTDDALPMRFRRCGSKVADDVLATWLEVHFGRPQNVERIEDLVSWVRPEGIDAELVLTRVATLGKRGDVSGRMADAAMRTADVLADDTSGPAARVAALDLLRTEVRRLKKHDVKGKAAPDATRAYCAALSEVAAAALLSRMEADRSPEDDGLSDFAP